MNIEEAINVFFDKKHVLDLAGVEIKNVYLSIDLYTRLRKENNHLLGVSILENNETNEFYGYPVIKTLGANHIGIGI